MNNNDIINHTHLIRAMVANSEKGNNDVIRNK